MAVKQYTNSTKTSGIQVIEATPIDDRLHVASEQALIEVFDDDVSPEDNEYISVLYDGMVVKSRSSRISYIWVESDYGLLPNGYTYPPYATDIAGQNYANKTYNFMIYDSTVKLTKIFDDVDMVGIFVSNSELPYKVFKDKLSANIVLKSSTTGFLELEFPDKIEETAYGINIILDPKPEISETFKIIIS